MNDAITYPCITCDTGRCSILAAPCAACVEKQQVEWMKIIIETPPAEVAPNEDK